MTDIERDHDAADRHVNKALGPRAGTWVGDDRLVVGAVEFTVTGDADRYLNEEPTPDRFVVAKTPEMVRRLERTIARLAPQRIVELGIFKGGSAVLIALLARPEKLTAIDLVAEPVAALEDFILAEGLAEVLVTHYGVDQGERGPLSVLLEQDHGDQSLDLVVDDASHQYRATRTSFEVLFPRLRPGGCFIIEDWAWAHFPEPLWQEAGGWWHNRPALTNLVVELMMVAGTGAELIADIAVHRDTVTVTRGPLELTGPLRLEAHYKNRQLPFRPLL